jgi:isoleucyl-tRNA synthetase
MTAFKEVSPQPDYKSLESTVLEFWRSNTIFERSSAKPAPAGEFVFFEGPPTANGQPAMHHVLARAFKDLFPRFKTMKGFHVTRKGGWDTHGLPVEISVEKKLGMKGRNHGATRAEMEEFNRLCRESVFTNIQDWNEFTERMGYWVDLEHPYVTYHNAYIESVWNLLKRMWDRGLVERDFKVVPVSPRIGSTLSKAELGDENSYQMVDDPSVYVRFPVKLESTPDALKAELERQGVKLESLENPALIVWTTTPWTLPSNTMAAVNPDLEYVLAASPMGHIVVASGAVERMTALYKEQPLEVVATFKGELMEWWQYEQPFPEVFAELGLNEEKSAPRKAGARGAGTAHPRAHFVALAAFVGDEDGSGIAHEAPVYGAEDLELSKVYDSVLCFGTNGNGIMQVTDERSKFFKDADKGLVKEMKARGVMYHAGTLKHRYPFHDRTGDPILYFARPSWFVRTHKMAGRMVETNQEINWVPEHIKNGRFGNWLEGNVDWGISRERYWGTPLPFWISEDGRDYVCVGSVKELEALMGKKLENEDLHRPYIDDATFVKDGKKYTRVPEVLDVWFDSGAMPYAQWHLVFDADGVAQSKEALETFEKHFPADFISEAIDQTRGWFYSLHAISTLLYDQPAFKNVICLGHLVDEKGQKMSKSKGNVVEPLPAFDKYGADSVRWYMFTATEPGDVKRFSERLVAEAQRGFVNTLWNVYAFFVLYANLDQPKLETAPKLEDRPEIDRWLISRLEQTVQVVNDALERYDARGAGRALEAFVEGLSNWYVRRNRRRFWTQDGKVDTAAYATLYEALVTVTKLAAPFTPFLAEHLYQNLVRNVDSSAPESVHLCDFPAFDASRVDAKLVQEMDAVLKVVDLGRAARGQANLKLRQPLSEVMVRARGAGDAAALERFADTIAEELNVKALKLLEEGTNLVSYTLKPNLPTLGRKYGKNIPAIRDALQNGDAAKIVAHVNAGQSFTLETSDGAFTLEPADVLVDAKSPEGYAAMEQDGFLVAFSTTLTRELVLEGLAKDLQRAVQQARKDAGLEVSNRIALRFELEGETLEALRAHADTIKGETLCESLEYTAPLDTDFVVTLEEGGRFGLAKV